MTTRFIKALDYVFEHEGGYNNIKEDKGGATNWGVSLALLKQLGEDIDGDGDIDWVDVKKLTKEHAESIYWNNFWRPFYDTLPERLAIKVFDTAVNAGNKRAHIILQQAINSTNKTPLEQDGIIGVSTLNQAMRMPVDALLEAYCKKQKEFYEDIVNRKPDQVKFIIGWRKRAKWLPN